MRSPRRPQQVPQVPGLLRGHVQLPAELPHIGDARAEHHRVAKFKGFGHPERTGRTLIPAPSRRGEHVASAWSPEPDRGPGRGDVGELRVARQVIADPPVSYTHLTLPTIY